MQADIDGLVQALDEESQRYFADERYVMQQELKYHGLQPHALIDWFAYFSAKLKKHFDSGLTTMYQTLLARVAPFMIRPRASKTIISIVAREALKIKETVPKNTCLAAPCDKENNAVYQFYTDEEIDVLPCRLNDISLSDESYRLRLHLGVNHGVSTLKFREFRFYINIESPLRFELHHCLLTDLSHILIAYQGKPVQKIEPRHLKQMRFDDKGLYQDVESLMSLVDDYFNFSACFSIFTLKGLSPILLDGDNEFDIDFVFNHPLQINRQLDKHLMHINICIATNVIQKSIEPLFVNGKNWRYPLCLSADNNHQYSLVNIDSVSSRFNQEPGGAIFKSFANQQIGVQDNCFCLSHSATPFGLSYLSFSGRDAHKEQVVAVVASLAQGHRPRKFVKTQQLNLEDEGLAYYLIGTNLTIPSKYHHIIDDNHHFLALVESLSLTSQSMTSKDSLQKFLSLFARSKQADAKIKAICSLLLSTTHRIKNGTVIQGLAYHLSLDDEFFEHFSEAYLFAYLCHVILVFFSEFNLYIETKVTFEQCEKELIWSSPLRQLAE